MIKLCIFSDIHYIDRIPNWPKKRKLVEYAEQATNKMVYEINNEIKPDIAINLGDIIQATGDWEKDKMNILHILDILREIKCPYYTLMGNHELKSVENNRELLKIFNYESATFSIDYDDYHLLFIGTDINNEDKEYRTQYISDMDLEYIKNDLEANKDKKTIVFSHFGIAEDANINQNFWCYSEDGENLMLRNRQQLKDMLKNKNIIGVFCGHQHWTKKITENGINYYMLGSLTEDINNNGIPDGVYFEVNIDEENVIVIEKHLKLKNKENIIDR